MIASSAMKIHRTTGIRRRNGTRRETPTPLRLRRPNMAKDYPAGARLLGRVVLAAHDVQRDVGLVAHNPAVVARRDVEEVARPHDPLLPVVHPHRGAAAEDQTDVLHRARGLARRRTDMLRPAPARLVGGAAGGHGTDGIELEAALLELADLRGRVEVDQGEVHDRSGKPPIAYV